MPLTASHGSDDHVSHVNAVDIVEAIRVYISNSVSSVRNNIRLDTLRPLPMFLGMGHEGFCLESGAFTPPIKGMDKASFEKFQSRIKLNVAYFLTNYAVVCAGVAVVVALMHPTMILGALLVNGLWTLHGYLISNELLLFGRNIGSILSISQRFYLLLTLTVVFVIWGCLVPFLIFLTISSLIILSHAIMRDPKHTEKYGHETMRSSYSGESDEGDDWKSGGSGVLVDRPHREV